MENALPVAINPRFQEFIFYHLAGAMSTGAGQGSVLHGVDVSSGVEITPGLKDHAKMRALIRAVRQWDLSQSP